MRREQLDASLTDSLSRQPEGPQPTVPQPTNVQPLGDDRLTVENDPVAHVVLYQPEIPQNTRNIGRTCVAVGAKLWFVRPLGFQLDDRYLKRAGMDYWRSLDVHEHADWPTFRASLLAPKRLWLFTTKTTQSFWSVDYQDGDGLLFGNEGWGAPEWLHDEIGETQRVTIPHANSELRSLNLSTAAGIGCYEAMRQTGLLSG